MAQWFQFWWLMLVFAAPACQEQGPETFTWPQQGVVAHYAFKLPDAVDECSGAISWTDSTFLTHNDDGPAEIFEVSYSGRLVRTLAIPDAENTDWEDLTHDDDGNIYISDLGNNRNTRRDLCIYIYKPGTAKASKIKVEYGDQHDFPPIEAQKNFDSEAIFYWGKKLYAISKNRGSKLVRVYQIPAQPGSYRVHAADSIKLLEPVTGAAVSPNKKVLAVVAYGKIYLFALVPGHRVLSHPTDSLRFAKSGQAEAIWWRDQAHFYVGNEAQRVFEFVKEDGGGF